MLALVLFVAVAVDGGQAYFERRQMQNAADAGAIVGDTIKLNGSNSELHGGTEAAGPPTVRLIR